MPDYLVIDPKQIQPNWCWAAVASTLAGYYFDDKPPLTQCDIAGLVLNQNCCPNNQACNQGQDFDVVMDRLNAKIIERQYVNGPMNKTHLTRPMFFDDIRNSIDSGVPICAFI